MPHLIPLVLAGAIIDSAAAQQRNAQA